MIDNSDYKKKHINLKDLIPSALVTDTNKALVYNVFGRYVTKDEMEKVYGIVGEQNPAASENRHISELTPHRSAFQLQPLMFKKIATVNHLLSHKDVLQKLSVLGVDPNRMDTWGQTEQFNFVPPIDLDKIVNYVNYYWYNPENPDSDPQYVTIKNRCVVAQSAVNAKLQELGGQYQYNIIGFNAANKTIDISGNFVSVFDAGKQFEITGSTNNDGSFNTVSSQSVGSNTRIFVVEAIDASVVDGQVTFDSVMSPLLAARDCACYGSIGWGAGGYDSEPYDGSSSCVIQDDSWFSENYWVHYIDMPPGGFSIAKRATMPIIEYLSTVELNQWSYTKYRWDYRKDSLWDWSEVSNEPTIEEMNTFYLISSVNVGLQTITLDASLGDLTSIFTTGFGFSVENTAANRTVTGLFEVASSLYSGTNTVITTVDPFTLIEAIPGNNVVPVSKTSLGDTWNGFYEHWALIGEQETVPSDNRVLNPNIIFDEFTTPDLSIVGLDNAFSIITVNNDHTAIFYPGYQFTVVDSLNNSGTFTVASSVLNGSQTDITVLETVNDSIIDGEILSPTEFDLSIGNDSIALFGTDSIRVYVNGLRTYTTYSEIANGIYVGGINFYTGFTGFTKVTIEVNSASLEDVGREAVLVRTELNDAAFSLSGPEEVSLIRYRKTEQVKTPGVTEYPLFNIYNMDGTYHGVSSIWKFQESTDQTVDSRTGLRLVTSQNGRVYYFEQFLIDEDNGVMYAYKDSNTISFSNPYGLQTIWRLGFGGAELYTPQYVDKDRNVVTIGDPSGDWEVPHQLYYNPLHENKKILSTAELLLHFRSIIESQPTPSGFRPLEAPWRLISNPNYGLGGNIKEHNDSYDTFLSTIFVKSSDPISIIEFAQDRYERNINYIKSTFENDIDVALTTLNANYITNLADTLSANIISAFELNDVNNIIYGDSNTYNELTSQGIKGWIATLPFIRMAFKNQPLLLVDDVLGIKEISSHDAHISSYTIDYQPIIATILSASYPLGGTWGTTQPTTPPTNMTTYLTYNGNAGKYWLDSSTNVLYRFAVISVGGTLPTSTVLNSKWYDTSVNLLKYFNGTSWVPVVGTPYDIQDAWEILDIENVLGSVLLDVEQKLYDAAPELTQLAYDITSLQSYAEYDTYLEEAFLDLMKIRGISNPYSVTGYFDQMDAFTWNYKDVNVNVVNYPTIATSTNKPWGSTWWDINLKVFGTYYPHLEPWKLQGYSEKPQWWDSYYKWTVDNTRRWQPSMWTNLQNGVVPFGELLPSLVTSTGSAGEVTQYTHFSVDTLTDELLPPYVSSSPNTLLSNIVDIPSTIDSDYVFGENGPQEWSWRKSSQYIYDLLKVAYRLEPVKFIHNTFGEKFFIVGGLQVNQRENKVYSHSNAVFHGDLLNGDTYVVDGLNQWYINYNRTKNLDNKISDFRDLWTGWISKLAYQFDAFIDDTTLQIYAKSFFPKENDYDILIKKSEGYKDYWLDSINVEMTSNTPKVIAGDHGDAWTFTIKTPNPVHHEIQYYDVNTSVIDTQFIAFNGATTSEVWDHYTIDKNVVKTALTPFTITGVQNAINFVDGYAEFVKDQGFVFNHTDAADIDPTTGRTVSWKYEIERFINTMYVARNAGRRNNKVEINPFMNNIWFKNEHGVVSDVVVGPFTTVRTENTIYDQYGRILKNDYLHVYREDSFARIGLMSPNIQNDVEPSINPYTFLHIGGMHLFLDNYEHVILFNNYTVSDDLIYDPFLGLNVPRLLLDFNRQENRTGRPNVGGMFLNNNVLSRNIEGSIDDIASYYDTYTVNENALFSRDARSVLGYDERDVAYLDHLAVTEKSKFLFWKGMIQNKGSINSVKAFLNSVHFIDANVDEFWAFKLSEFGESERRIYPEIKLNVDDIINDRLLLEFTNGTPDTDFIAVPEADQARWFEWPDQIEKLIGDNLFFDCEVTSKITSPSPISGDVFETDVICDSIRVPFFQGFAKNVFNNITGVNVVLGLSFSYVPESDNLAVYIDGQLTNQFTDTTSPNITITATLANSTVVVIRKAGVLPDSEVVRINSRLYHIPNYASLGSFNIYTLNAAKTKLSPSKLIDYKSNVVLEDIPLWNPALNHNSPLAIHTVDFQRDTDIAKYSDVFQNINVDTTLNYWGENEVGKVWWDTSNVGYLPYYDSAIYPTISERVNNWGLLAEWSNISVYEWVSSGVSPSNWLDSGTPRTSVYKRTRDYDYFNIEKFQLASTKVNLVSTNYGKISANDKTELTFSDYTMIVIINNSLPSQQVINVVVDGQYTKTFNELLEQIRNDIPTTVNVSLVEDGLLFTAIDPSVIKIDVVGDETKTLDLLYSLTKNFEPLFGLRFNIDEHIANPTNKFIINGDFTTTFTFGLNFNVYDTFTGTNNGAYTVVSSVLNNNRTEINVSQFMNADSGGVISVLLGTVTKPITNSVDSYITNVLPTDPCVTGLTLVAGMKVFAKEVSILPDGIAEHKVYYVLNNPNVVGQFILSEDLAGTKPVRVTDIGVITLMDFEWNNAWIKDTEQHVDLNYFDPLIPSTKNPNFNPCDTVNLYLNGIFKQTVVLDSLGTITGISFTINQEDTLHVVRPVHDITEVEQLFDPSVLDDGTYLTQYHKDFEYVTRTKTVNNVDITTYYFWVSNRTDIAQGNLMSIQEVVSQLKKIPTPFMFYQKVLRGYSTTDMQGRTVIVPDRYDQVVVRGLATKVSENNRYKLRFIQDFSLRDNINDGNSALDLKNKHEEWVMFREKQKLRIRQELWNRMVEALIGFTLKSFQTLNPVIVPSFERQLFDEKFGTDTRFGLGNGQAFVDSVIGIATIYAVIQDPKFDISPVDKDWFLNTYTFDTPENVKLALDYIYNSFPVLTVNHIFFEVLLDAFSMKTKYEEIFKTSWIALQGVRLLQTAGSITDDL